MKNIKKILFVCTGNSCRSIMAEAYARKRFKDEGLEIEVRSAGTLGVEGLTPTTEALKVLSLNNIPTEELHSTPVAPEMLEWADMVLVMEPEHKTFLSRIMPEEKTKIRLLGEFNKNPGNAVIPDPIGRPLSYYRASFRLIKEPIEELILCLKK